MAAFGMEALIVGAIAMLSVSVALHNIMWVERWLGGRRCAGVGPGGLASLWSMRRQSWRVLSLERERNAWQHLAWRRS